MFINFIERIPHDGLGPLEQLVNQLAVDLKDRFTLFLRCRCGLHWARGSLSFFASCAGNHLASTLQSKLLKDEVEHFPDIFLSDLLELLLVDQDHIQVVGILSHQTQLDELVPVEISPTAFIRCNDISAALLNFLEVWPRQSCGTPVFFPLGC